MPTASSPAPATGVTPAEQVEVRPLQCGRCREMFDGDATLHPEALPAWWVCPPCRLALFGDHKRR